MTIAELVQEFDAEAETTLRVLERVPSDKLAWTPHSKSMSLGRLAMHLASAPSNISALPVSDHFEFTGDPTPVPTCTADIVAAPDRGVERVREHLEKIGDGGVGGAGGG